MGAKVRPSQAYLAMYCDPDPAQGSNCQAQCLHFSQRCESH